jgi:P27 family predicted phage terminase small subunit
MGARGTKPKDNLGADISKVAPLATTPPLLRGGAEAKAEFRRLATQLTKLGHLSSLQRECLVQYCEAYVLCRQALDKIHEDGVTLENAETGNQYMHPALSAYSLALGVMEKQAKNLGMTPLSLQSIKSVKTTKNAPQTHGPSNFLTGEAED